MNVLRAAAALVLALLLQAALASVWSGAHRYVDLTLVPVVLYGVGNSQRSAMLVGCAAGLTSDAWFQVGTFGINGFKRTLLGWLLGAVAGWLDLNSAGGRLAAGAAVSLGDHVLDFGLRTLLDQHPWPPVFTTWLAHAVLTGLAAAVGGGLTDRLVGRRAARRLS